MPDASIHALIAETLDDLMERLDALDHDELDVDGGDGKLTIAFESGGGPLIVSRQGAADQIWLAEPGGGWHYDLREGEWRCDKRGVELYATLEQLLTARLGETIALK